MMEVPAIPIIEDLPSIGKRVVWVIERYGDLYPVLHENYTAIELLYVREYELEDTQVVAHDILTWLVERAMDGSLVKFPSVHRAITIEKKLFQDDGDRVRSDNLEWDWRKACREESREAPR